MKIFRISGAIEYILVKDCIFSDSHIYSGPVKIKDNEKSFMLIIFLFKVIFLASSSSARLEVYNTFFANISFERYYGVNKMIFL
jgi:hypothetical protein